MYCIWPERNKAGHQKQQKCEKVHKTVETKKHTSDENWIVGEIKKEVKNFLQLNENKNAIYQDL